MTCPMTISPIVGVRTTTTHLVHKDGVSQGRREAGRIRQEIRMVVCKAYIKTNLLPRIGMAPTVRHRPPSKRPPELACCGHHLAEALNEVSILRFSSAHVPYQP
jgi:hypothetical protein